MVIRFLIMVLVIAANVPARAEPLLQRPVLRTYQPVRVALLDFAAAGVSEAEAAHEISQIVASDLKQSSAFALIDKTAFAEKNASIDETPGFADWRVINAQRLVVGRVTGRPDGRIKVEFRLWDAFRGEQISGWQYTGAADDLSRIGHMISKDIYEHIIGEKRIFD